MSRGCRFTSEGMMRWLWCLKRMEETKSYDVFGINKEKY